MIVIAPEDIYSARLKEFGCEYWPLSVDSKGTNPLRDLCLIYQLWRIYGNAKADVSFNYTIKCSIYATIAGTMRGVRCIPVITGAGYVFGTTNWIAKVAKILYWFAFRRVTEVWFLNRDDRALFASQGLLPASKSTVLPGEGVEVSLLDVQRLGHISARVVAGSGVDTSEFVNAERPSRSGMPNSRFRFLLVARLIWEKGIAEYVEAARIVRRSYPSTTFQILGFIGVDNPSAIPRATVEKWEQDGIIEYLGTTDNVADTMLDADVVVLPSYYREGIPRSLLEAASLALPIITTDSVGCRETVDDGHSGLLVKPRNVQDLAEKMIQIIELPPEQRAKMGHAGREKMIREFDIRHVMKAYESAIGVPL